MSSIYTYMHWLIERDRVCAHCGKVFQTHGDEWGYYYQGKIACSYGCMRAMENEDTSRIPSSEFDGNESASTRRRIGPKDIQRIETMYKAGHTVRNICESTGFGQTTVKAVLRSGNITKKAPRITKEQQKSFILLYESGLSYGTIARKCHVSSSTVRRHVMGKIRAT